MEKYPIDKRSMPYVEDFVIKIVMNNSTAIKEVLGHEGLRRDLIKQSIRELLSEACDVASMTGLRTNFIPPQYVDAAFDRLNAGCRGVFPLWD